MTSARPPTRWASTWAICGERPRWAQSRACCTRFAASATCCAEDDPMSFRRRITLASAAAVTIAVVLASGLVYLLTSHELRGQVDAQLRNRVDSLRLVAHGPARPRGRPLLDILRDRSPSARALLEGTAIAPGNGPRHLSPPPHP